MINRKFRGIFIPYNFILGMFQKNLGSLGLLSRVLITTTTTSNSIVALAFCNPILEAVSPVGNW